jgi:hypothetical protein
VRSEAENRRNGQAFGIGAQRGPADRALIAHEDFFDWLSAQNDRVTTGSLILFRYPVLMVGSLIFALCDGGDLVCCLPRSHRSAALDLPGARLWAPSDGPDVFERWVRLPATAELGQWRHFSLAALRYAVDWLAHDDLWRAQNL